MDIPNAPNMAKLDSVWPQWQAVQDFVNYLEENGYSISKWVEDNQTGQYLREYGTADISRMQHDHFQIDYDALESERKLLLQFLVSKDI